MTPFLCSLTPRYASDVVVGRATAIVGMIAIIKKWGP